MVQKFWKPYASPFVVTFIYSQTACFSNILPYRGSIKKKVSKNFLIYFMKIESNCSFLAEPV